MSKSDLIKIVIAGVTLAAAGALFFWRGGKSGTGELTNFYDLSEKKLFAAPRGAFAPIDGIGGESGDGVEAVVIRCPKCDPDQIKVAYLKTHTPEYKQKREESRAADDLIPGLTRQWITENTLVRRLDEEEWHLTSTPEGSKIVSGWREKCPTHREWMKLVKP